MNTFLLLVLVQISTGRYDTKMAPSESMEVCQSALVEVAKTIPKQEGISYWIGCVQVKATDGKPV